jgi:hypothetical protein
VLAVLLSGLLAAIRICPLAATKKTPWSLQSVTGFASRRTATLSLPIRDACWSSRKLRLHARRMSFRLAASRRPDRLIGQEIRPGCRAIQIRAGPHAIAAAGLLPGTSARPSKRWPASGDSRPDRAKPGIA